MGEIRIKFILYLISFTQTIEDETLDDHGRKSSPETTRKSDSKPDVVINMPVPEMHSVGGVLVHMPHVCFLRVKFVNHNPLHVNLTLRVLPGSVRPRPNFHFLGNSC